MDQVFVRMELISSEAMSSNKQTGEFPIARRVTEDRLRMTL